SGSGTFTLTASTLSVPSLENGVPVQIQLAGSGTFALYKLVVPQGATSADFAMLPGNDANVAQSSCQAGFVVTSCSPDADLYVRFGAIPTLSAYHCRPWAYGNAESCTFSTEARALTGLDPTGFDYNHVHNFNGPGKYFVMVRSFTGAPNVVLQGATA
ncbi:MAG TPA: PPC domain-containing protein, partial [Candidatus Thermoplasmatota archaeon]|nr:PPC domain-containing protein [Candidatus Thermoplasmatota archaeon]